MKNFRLLTILIMTIGIVLFYVQPVMAFPPMPSSFWGTVKIDGAFVPVNTVVSARINGVQYASTIASAYQGEIYYSLDIPGDDSESAGIIEGGMEGDTITFYIGSIKATQTAIWHTGTMVSLNLTGYTAEPTSFTLFLPIIKR
jgi:hypothetical protein